jgi:WD40 repeat protein
VWAESSEPTIRKSVGSEDFAHPTKPGFMQVLSIGKKKRFYAIAFSPDGRDLATVSGDGFLRVWDLGSGQERQRIAVEETSCGYDIAYLDPDRLIFAGIELRWWDSRPMAGTSSRPACAGIVNSVSRRIDDCWPRPIKPVQPIGATRA